MIETLGSFVLVALGSGTSIWFLNWLTEKRKRKSEVKYLATRIAVNLEGYAIDCADRGASHLSHEETSGLAGELIDKIPTIPILPETENYILLDTALLEEILSLPQQLMLFERDLRYLFSVTDFEEIQKEYCTKTLKIGSMALELSKRIRAKYHLPKRELKSGSWDIDNFYKEKMADLNKPPKYYVVEAEQTKD